MKHPVSLSRAILGTSPGSGLVERVGDRLLVCGAVVLPVCSSVLPAYSLPVCGESAVFTGPGPSGSRPEPVWVLGTSPCRLLLDGISCRRSGALGPRSRSALSFCEESRIFYTGGSPVSTPSPGVLCYRDEVPPRDAPWHRLMAGGGTRQPPLRLSRPVAASGRHNVKNMVSYIPFLCHTP